MNYDRPRIIYTGPVLKAIQGGQQKVPYNCAESQNILYLMTPPAYEADE